jgi:NAD(P)-dependent dehydrogenase (short-subunit alcohol dehydrogenase family)
MLELVGRTAVITGAASGIGLEMARRFAAAGMQLMLADIEAEPLEAARSELANGGASVASFELDVREYTQIEALEAAARDRFGNVHVLCNNAGVGAGGPVVGTDDLDVWRWAIDINLWGVIYGCKVFIPAMAAHGEPCHVVNTASMAGLAPSPFMGPYTIAKYGVVALSETLSLEMQMAKNNVGVSVLCPAFVRTAIADSKRNLPPELAEAHGAPQEMESIMHALVDGGIDPTLVAEAVHQAILDDSFWILTHDESKPAIVARAESIADNQKPSFLG